MRVPPYDDRELLAAMSDLTTLACAGVPGCDAASVTLWTDDGLRSIAASHEAARQMDLSQSAEEAGPCVSAITDGVEVLVEDYSRDHRWPAVTRRAIQNGIRSSLSLPLPLHSEQRVLGALNMFATEVAAFDDHGRHLAELLVQQAAAALSYLELLGTERAARISDHHIAETLQLGMSSSISDLPGMTCAARYLTGAEEAQVGGDWYDVFPLPDGAVAVAIGDTMGHDVHAAVAMGQLRSVLRSYAYDGSSPSAVLDRLDRLVQGFEMTPFATAFYGRLVLDRDGAMLVFSNAGHPPPLLLLADGSVQQLHGGGSHAIGAPLPEVTRADAAALLPTGSTLVLFTDGLVERKDLDLSSGLTLLAQAIAAHPPTDPPDTLCDRLLNTLLPEGQRDDITLLAVRVD
jgi:serine phosphatase RsbU (regulator of sigma subunit)